MTTEPTTEKDEAKPGEEKELPPMYAPLFKVTKAAELFTDENRTLAAKLYDRHLAHFQVLCDVLREAGIPAARINEMRRDVKERVTQARKLAKKNKGRDPNQWMYTDRGEKKANHHNIMLALRLMKKTMWFNEFDQLVYVSDGPEGEKVWVDNPVMNAMWTQLDMDFDFEPSKDKFVTSLEVLAYENKYHPVREYLDSLKWDGKERLRTWLHDFFGVPQSDYSRESGTLFLKGMVARVMEPGCKFDEMLLLIGGQGLEKSSALEALMPYSEWFTDSLPIHETDQKIIEISTGCWLCEISDLKGENRAEIESVKAMLSKKKESARMAYARMKVVVKRQFGISGTSNKDEPLSDPTGNRRYWPQDCTKADARGIAAARDQLWAEAYAAWKANKNIRLDPKYYDQFRQVQAAHQKENPMETSLRTVLAPFGKGGVVAATTLWDSINVGVTQRAGQQDKFGVALKALGWKRGQKRLSRGHDPVGVYSKGDGKRVIVLDGYGGKLRYRDEIEDFNEADEAPADDGYDGL